MLKIKSSYTVVTKLISILLILVSCSKIENDKKQAIELMWIFIKKQYYL